MTIYYNNETGESYPISHVRPFMKPSGNRKPTPLARHAFNTDLSVSLQKLSKHGERQTRFNRRHHLLLQDE